MKIIHPQTLCEHLFLVLSQQHMYILILSHRIQTYSYLQLIHWASLGDKNGLQCFFNEVRCSDADVFICICNVWMITHKIHLHSHTLSNMCFICAVMSLKIHFILCSSSAFSRICYMLLKWWSYHFPTHIYTTEDETLSLTEMSVYGWSSKLNTLHLKVPHYIDVKITGQIYITSEYMSSYQKTCHVSPLHTVCFKCLWCSSSRTLSFQSDTDHLKKKTKTNVVFNHKHTLPLQPA